jgi:hypothetical protein
VGVVGIAMGVLLAAAVAVAWALACEDELEVLVSANVATTPMTTIVAKIPMNQIHRLRCGFLGG